MSQYFFEKVVIFGSSLSCFEQQWPWKSNKNFQQGATKDRFTVVLLWRILGGFC
jgi:hypothetical protein